MPPASTTPDRVDAGTRRRPDLQANISRVPYLPGLDGMRALAVVAVMVYHANSDWLPGGFLGVEVFFVISGYLITLLLISEHERTDTRRHEGLLDPAGPAPAAGAVHDAVRAHDLDGAVRARRRSASCAATSSPRCLRARTGTRSGPARATARPNDFAPLRHLWSLAVEEQFYLIWPVVMVLLLRVGSRRVADLSRWLFVAAVADHVVVAVLYYSGPIGTRDVTPEAYWHIVGRHIAKADASTCRRSPAPAACCSARRSPWSGGRSRDARPDARPGAAARRLGVVGLVALLAADVWRSASSTADGADPLLFRGGFFVSASPRWW